MVLDNGYAKTIRNDLLAIDIEVYQIFYSSPSEQTPGSKESAKTISS